MNRLAWLLASPLLVSQLHAADLLQIYREAQTNDAVYAAARANLKAGQEKLPQARAGLLPTLGVSGNTQWNENEIRRRDGDILAKPNFNSNGYTVSLSQPLFRWQNWVAYDQSKYLVAQAEANYVQASRTSSCAPPRPTSTCSTRRKI